MGEYVLGGCDRGKGGGSRVKEGRDEREHWKYGGVCVGWV